MADNTRVEITLEQRMANEIVSLGKRITELETCMENMRGSGFKLDYMAKLKASPELTQALKEAISMCLPVQKSIKWTDKLGVEKSFSSLKDYQEASNAAIRTNGISITFDEDKETMQLTTNVSLLSTGERRAIKTTVKPANKPDPEQAKTFGFMNAKGKMLVNLLNLE